MAAKPNEQKKQELKQSLRNKKSSIKKRVHTVKNLVNQSNEQNSSSTGAALPPKRLNIVPDFNLTNSQNQVKSVQKGMSQFSSTIANQTPKSLAFIAGGALVCVFTVRSFFAAKKKKKLKANAQIAKMGAGILFFKWILGVSQPAVKQLVKQLVQSKLRL